MANKKRFVVIEGVPVRTIALNREDANPSAGVFFVADPRLGGYMVCGDGRVRGRLWLEKKNDDS